MCLMHMVQNQNGTPAAGWQEADHSDNAVSFLDRTKSVAASTFTSYKNSRSDVRCMWFRTRLVACDAAGRGRTKLALLSESLVATRMCEI
jgi:hypothetical protein